jgi:hypothetical protein
MSCCYLTNSQVDALEMMATSDLEHTRAGPWLAQNRPLGPKVRDDTLHALSRRGFCKILPKGIATLTDAGERELAALKAVRRRLSMA